jgi:orotidine-5'-phosphate decarboxylase
MMSEAALALKEDAARRNVDKPLLLGVTLLTSLDGDHLERFRVLVDKPHEYVVQLALLAQQAGLDGVVASPNETTSIKKATGTDFVTVTPGIRLNAGTAEDQKRIMTPEMAAATGTDYIVVGRPITRAEDPLAIAEAINQKLEGK